MSTIGFLLSVTPHSVSTPVHFLMYIMRSWRANCEAQGGEDVPGGHLAAVIVATEGIGLVAILGLDDFMEAPGRLPGLAGIAVEIDDMMARLVAMPGFSNPALDVLVLPSPWVPTKGRM